MWIPYLSRHKQLWKKRPPITISFLLLGGVTVISAIVVVTSYYKYTNSHIPPNTYINSISVGTLTYDEASRKLQTELPNLPAHTVTLEVEGIAVSSTSAELGQHYNVNEVLSQIKNRTTTGKLRWQTWWRVIPLIQPVYETTQAIYSPEKVGQLIALLDQKISYFGEEPQATLKISGNQNTLTVTKGKFGRAIDLEHTTAALAAAGLTQSATIAAAIASPGGELNREEIRMAQDRSIKYIDKSIKFNYLNNDLLINDQDMISFLTFPDGYNLEKITALVNEWKKSLDRPAQEPEFEYDKTTLTVHTFVPPRDGLSLDDKKTVEQVLLALKAIETEPAKTDVGSKVSEEVEEAIQLKVATTPPQKSLANTNDIGITELIGFGDSHYDHSIPNRIHNVAITTKRISDVLVPPGAEFSFNKTLGDVSAATGFRSAYVIKNGQTALGDGGGVCQVSTTLFRSVLNAGLKVTKRLPHSYRVSYYELDRKPGIDATVYAGETDLRFINDTGKHILIHAKADSKNLYMYVDIFGTSDGRTTQIMDHKTWNYRPALPPQYIPDPSLPAGALKQVDWAAPGISASFVNVIKDKDGKVMREDTYVSNYQPWAAKYLQGIAQ